ncbi:MAG: hypothetical protein HOK30_06855 [Rhodospirillaceae bacterium]|nr:hypothetical protein [Rhodospirillaceae bacterium]
MNLEANLPDVHGNAVDATTFQPFAGIHGGGAVGIFIDNNKHQPFAAFQWRGRDIANAGIIQFHR